MSDTALSYRQQVMSAASGSWTATKLNALTARIGYASSMGGQPYWQGLVVQYATNS